MPESDRSRRLFLLSSAALLGGCASSKSASVVALPDLVWGTGTTRPRTETVRPARPDPVPSGVIPRSQWAKGDPIPSRMNRMRPIRRITVHHDGMSAFTQTSSRDAATRLETIRRSHLRRSPQPFGDIGYHFAVDPSGRVWQCRPLQWQGAHVARQNDGNLGIVLLGNYDKQRPNSAQQSALVAFIDSQMKRYRIGASQVLTHQEMAATACPGRNLQAFMTSARRGPLA